jgi:6,7-dimethyl-8-ribityllumazine synthase
MSNIFEGTKSAAGMRLAIISTRWNEAILARLVAGAREAALDQGVDAENIDLAIAPGAFEVPLVARKLAASGRYDAIAALGCVIRGETPHFDYIASEAARGIADVAHDTGVPVAFGVLTVDNVEQANARAENNARNNARNKGGETMLAAIETANLLRAIEEK